MAMEQGTIHVQWNTENAKLCDSVKNVFVYRGFDDWNIDKEYLDDEIVDNNTLNT